LSDHEETARRRKQQELEQALFPKGGFNAHFYETSLLKTVFLNDPPQSAEEEKSDEADEQYIVTKLSELSD